MLYLSQGQQLIMAAANLAQSDKYRAALVRYEYLTMRNITNPISRNDVPYSRLDVHFMGGVVTYRPNAKLKTSINAYNNEMTTAAGIELLHAFCADLEKLDL